MKKLVSLLLFVLLWSSTLLHAQNNGKIYAVVKQMPQLMEGGLQSYIYHHTTYPAKAKEQKLEGNVVVGFVVEPSGQVSTVKVMKSVHALLDQEAVKIISALPRFTPGYHEGKPVRVQMYVPVKFSLKPLPEPKEEQPPMGTEEMVVADGDMVQAEADMIQAEVDLIQGDPNGMDPDAMIEGTPDVPDANEEEVVVFAEQMPEFPGNLNEYILKNMIYPKYAREQSVEGKVIAQFIIDKEGRISQAEIIRKVGFGLDEEALRIINNMPNWKPAKQNGKPVALRYNLPIIFKLTETTKTPVATHEPPAPKQDDIITFAEQMPEFNGDLQKYLAKNINYPTSARELGLSGKVIASFVVEKDGSVSNVEILRAAGKDFDAEAIRVIKSMPNWKPGKQNGKPVRIRFTLPITFALK
jgi:TonB family protein